ncbi:unnamed protein product [Caenorhabditis bovis]|uniref:G-protein coupled receptors family 1 profile domain-containing protein n=1 Tax=Caenorhabditis bovis TaxID=2654633 RepID=A0A8S1EEU2_9PELO|nr:unnamed protein product [Caenorhabditis bovis]
MDAVFTFIQINYNMITTCLSVIVNSIFVYLTMYKSRKAMGSYQEILAATGVFEIFYSMLIVVSDQLLFISPDVFMVYMRPGAIFDQTPFVLHIMSIKVCCIGLTYGLLEVHFIYRYIAVCKPHYMNHLASGAFKLAIFLYFILHGLSIYLIYIILLPCDRDTKSNFLGPVFNKTGIDIEQRDVLCMTMTKGTGEVRFIGHLSIGLLYFFSLYSVMVYIVLGISIIRNLRRTVISRAAKSLQRYLTIALVVQTIIPVVTNFIPTIISWSCPMFQLTLPLLFWRFSQIFVSLFPIIDPIGVILILPEYRRSLLFCFQRHHEKHIDVISV